MSVVADPYLEAGIKYWKETLQLEEGSNQSRDGAKYTEVTDNEQSNACDKSGEEKSYSCPTCRKAYRWKISLQRHMRYECGKEAQFSCQFCSYRTKHRYSLGMHVRTRHLPTNT